VVVYKDPIPFIYAFLDAKFGDRLTFYGNTFPSQIRLPSIIIRTTGGIDAYRIQLLSRANDDITAMNSLVDVMNYLVGYGQWIPGIRVKWVQRESLPIPSVDQDSGKPEAWCYIRLEALETDE